MTETMISKIETWECSIPLANPIAFRWHTVTSREYTVVRVHTGSGVVADAVGLTRGLPVDLVVQDLMAPWLVGKDALDIPARLLDLRRATASHEQHGIIAAARSLLDIALWDIKAKVLGVPLWRLIGGMPRPVEALLVEGYELPGETDEQFADRLAARAKEGYRALKLEVAGYDDQRTVERRFGMLRDRVGDEVAVVIDVGGAWADVAEARAAIRRWERFAPTWVEDPFTRDRLHLVRALRAEVEVPLATGDEVSRPQDLLALLEEGAVDVLRVDATTLGGLSTLLEVAASARLRQVPLSTHAHPTTHQHLCFAWPDTTYIEVFPDEREFEPSHRLLASSITRRCEGGLLQPPEEPGSGLVADLAAVNSFARRHGVVAPD